MNFPILSSWQRFAFPLLLLIIGLFCFSYYEKRLGDFPRGDHHWSQSDRLALAQGYKTNGYNFFKPTTGNLETREGITAVDFPVHEYFIALLSALTGIKLEAVFQFYVLAWALVGYFFFYRLTLRITGEEWKGAVAVLFAFSSPVLAHYQYGYLPSITGFAALLIGYFYYFRFTESRQSRDLRTGLIFITLAALVRMPFHIFLFATLLQQLLGWGAPRLERRRLLLFYGAAYGVVVLNMLWKTWLTQAYGSRFLNTLTPPGSISQFVELMGTVWSKWPKQLFTDYHYILMGGVLTAFIIYKIKNKKLPESSRPVAVHASLALAGALVYHILMLRQYVDHEYYFIDSFFPPFLLFFSIGLITVLTDWFRSYSLGAAMAGGLLLAALFNSKVIQARKLVAHAGDLSMEIQQNFVGSDRLLDSLGIPSNARMLVIDAYTTNTPLLLMRRSGYTLLSTRTERLRDALKLPFDYAVVQNDYFSTDVVTSYPEILNRFERVGGNKKLSVLRPLAQPQPHTTEQLLGFPAAQAIVNVDFETPVSDPIWQSNSDPTTAGAGRAGSTGTVVERDKEFAALFACDLGKPNFNAILFDCYMLAPDQPEEITIACSAPHDDKSYYYKQTLVQLNRPGEWQYVQCFFPIRSYVPDGQRVKLYIWNNRKAKIQLDDLSARYFNFSAETK